MGFYVKLTQGPVPTLRSEQEDVHIIKSSHFGEQVRARLDCVGLGTECLPRDVDEV